MGDDAADDKQAENQSESVRTPVSLNRWERSAAAVSGAALLVVSSWVLLDDTDGIGVVAFVIVAGLFLFLAVVGKLPVKWSWGDRSVEMFVLEARQARAEAEAAAEVMSSDQLAEAAEIARAWNRASQLKFLARGGSDQSTLQRHAEFEWLAQKNVELAAQDVKADRVEFNVRQGLREFDAVVRKGDRTVWFDFKLTVSRQSLARLAETKSLVEGPLIVVYGEERISLGGLGQLPVRDLLLVSNHRDMIAKRLAQVLH